MNATTTEQTTSPASADRMLRLLAAISQTQAALTECQADEECTFRDDDMTALEYQLAVIANNLDNELPPDVALRQRVEAGDPLYVVLDHQRRGVPVPAELAKRAGRALKELFEDDQAEADEALTVPAAVA